MTDIETYRVLTDQWCRHILRLLCAIQDNMRDAAGNVPDMALCYRIAERGGLIQSFEKWTSVHEAWLQNAEASDTALVTGQMPKGAKQDAVPPSKQQDAIYDPVAKDMIPGEVDPAQVKPMWTAFYDRLQERYNRGEKLTKEAFTKIAKMLGSRNEPGQKFDDKVKELHKADGEWSKKRAIAAAAAWEAAP